ncbi:MAG: EamA/RhaT family transporter, partial [Prevotella sp.]|nr:EamA/RhaT family transporter [Prevotella sp.]
MTNDTQTSTPTRSIFQRPVWVAVFAITAAMVWGWAYPLIKLGF